jgi:hypothetical protein
LKCPPGLNNQRFVLLELPMLLFELVVGLLLAGALFALWSERLNVPCPALAIFSAGPP